jgi:hypothetical protein
MTSDAFDVNEAIVLHLRRYPGSNQAEFESHYGQEAEAAKDQVRAILNEAMRVEPDWNRMTLNEAGDYVESVMHERHPDLSPKALESIGNYYTFLMR